MFTTFPYPILILLWSLSKLALILVVVVRKSYFIRFGVRLHRAFCAGSACAARTKIYLVTNNNKHICWRQVDQRFITYNTVKLVGIVWSPFVRVPHSAIPSGLVLVGLPKFRDDLPHIKMVIREFMVVWRLDCLSPSVWSLHVGRRRW